MRRAADSVARHRCATRKWLFVVSSPAVVAVWRRPAGRLSRRASLRLVGLAGTPLDFSFVQHGGGIVQVHIRDPLEFLIFFTLRPDSSLRSRTRTMLFLKRRRDLPRALAILWSTALDDLRLMETVQWTGAFASTDASLEQYAAFVENLPRW